VDDDADVRVVLKGILRGTYRFLEAASAAEALRIIDADDPSVVLLDLDLGPKHEADGFHVLREIQEREPELPVVILSASKDTDTIVRAMKLGAAHYIGKTPRYDELGERLRIVLNERRRYFNLAAHRLPGTGEIVGSSRAMAEVRRLAAAAADADLPVLLLGETGTGKGLVARCIHRSGRRREAPYRDVNVAGLSTSLLDSELFGHERGSFTGADLRHRGLFELVSGGTLLLDEIGDLPRECQVKLLKVVEDGVFRRVGGGGDLRSDARILAATHADLEGMIETGAFRRDLFHRLAGLVIRIPALRERPEDIPELTTSFVGPDVRITDAAMTALSSHPWTGNVRELQQTLRRAVLLAAGSTIDVVHLGVAPSAPRVAPPRETDEDLLLSPYADASSTVMTRFRRRYLGDLLERCDGNIARAARESGIARTHLHALIRQLGLRE